MAGETDGLGATPDGPGKNWLPGLADLETALAVIERWRTHIAPYVCGRGGIELVKDLQAAIEEGIHQSRIEQANKRRDGWEDPNNHDFEEA